jgi:hypothetical protein
MHVYMLPSHTLAKKLQALLGFPCVTQFSKSNKPCVSCFLKWWQRGFPHVDMMTCWHDDMLTRWYDDKMTWWRTRQRGIPHVDMITWYMMTWWHDDTLTWWHDDMITWWRTRQQGIPEEEIGSVTHMTFAMAWGQ